MQHASSRLPQDIVRDQRRFVSPRSDPDSIKTMVSNRYRHISLDPRFFVFAPRHKALWKLVVIWSNNLWNLGTDRNHHTELRPLPLVWRDDQNGPNLDVFRNRKTHSKSANQQMAGFGLKTNLT
jgi:hypothetical protein